MILINSTEHLQRSNSFRSPVRSLLFCFFLFGLLSCGPYTFHDVSVDYSKVKTVKVGFIDNKARYINPQLSPRLTDNLKQKITSYTKLTQVSGDNADYQINA